MQMTCRHLTCLFSFQSSCLPQSVYFSSFQYCHCLWLHCPVLCKRGKTNRSIWLHNLWFHAFNFCSWCHHKQSLACSVTLSNTAALQNNSFCGSLVVRSLDSKACGIHSQIKNHKISLKLRTCGGVACLNNMLYEILVWHFPVLPPQIIFSEMVETIRKRSIGVYIYRVWSSIHQLSLAIHRCFQPPLKLIGLT